MKVKLPTHAANHEGPFQCKGHPLAGITQPAPLTPAQHAWMRENKPLYYTGNPLQDLSHIPQHLRCA
jgi:hypothetical protein